MSILDGLNEEQRKAAEKVDGPVLILAGAGSGKTRTVTYRIAHMIKELGISPLNIMALTFTNKAAKEMKERAENLIGPESQNLVVSTFHSFSVRLLKTYSERIGYGTNFNIYDVDDQKSIINKIKKELNIGNDELTPSKIANKISKLKEEGIGVNELENKIDLKISSNRIFHSVYKRYNEVLKSNNAMDFSDLLLNAKKLLEDPYVLERVQERYKYIIVDEYQDTNDIQYEIVSKIALKYKNICVVGDEDQSIYAFRGANINNILNFERDYKNAFVVKLEQNYRSTKTILNAANEIIKNNKSSKGKKLWTDRDKGEKIKVYNAQNIYDEATFIINEIKSKKNFGIQYKDMTILYRTNAQSRILEERLLNSNIPYKIYGGMQFFQRKEIKDILSYMSLLNNRSDNYNFLRVINSPKRSIGDKTLEKIEKNANNKGVSLLDSLLYVDEVEGLRVSTKDKLKQFYNMMNEIHSGLEEYTLKEIFDEIMTKTKYIDFIEDNKEDRIKNIEELLNSIIESEKQNPGISLSEYLDMISLTTTTDNLEETENFVKLMTVHSSKGLEFDYVYLAGMEDGLFPSCNFETTEDEIEEERRLCYVAVTRAKKELYVTHSSERMVWGQMNYMIKPSRFLSEMDQKSLEYLSEKIQKNIKKTEQNMLNNKKEKIENFNPFSTKSSVRTSNLKHHQDSKYKVGDTVNHIKFGQGKIKSIDSKSIIIDFMVGEKKLALVLAEKFLKD
ncbi:MAG: UvrD-helicase domain-containing protein [Leptotrichiaceae bacterium]|nr:UvrD-helicase domain-containing protein [Leptotrichiaceae bacterium]MBP6280873.1 UvrD-helicase domain-containing protein [Leptotrichiaceae bacterium]MBP7100230.1 UvrD-helicase domain-containing protein [Leptotrichiaceae bacterium]MBP7739579.1 UvrD-helicase domain-containing protein [Leptotrichiaceae bacterium]MBP9629952.1 UvrD-helicase domain-containing protein [Leptotrichiaceae bacterium]